MSEQWRRARCQQLWEEQQGLCFYCGAVMVAPMNQRLRHRKRPDAATIDHVVPQCQGGAIEWPNEVAACRTCNAAKADTPPTTDDLHRLQALKA